VVCDVPGTVVLGGACGLTTGNCVFGTVCTELLKCETLCRMAAPSCPQGTTCQRFYLDGAKMHLTISYGVCR
jgi:hypothetical protein